MLAEGFGEGIIRDDLRRIPSTGSAVGASEAVGQREVRREWHEWIEDEGRTVRRWIATGTHARSPLATPLFGVLSQSRTKIAPPRDHDGSQRLTMARNAARKDESDESKHEHSHSQLVVAEGIVSPLIRHLWIFWVTNDRAHADRPTSKLAVVCMLSLHRHGRGRANVASRIFRYGRSFAGPKRKPELGFVIAPCRA